MAFQSGHHHIHHRIMEDEEYYHMMLDDMERLERVHHHVSHPADYQLAEQHQHRAHNPFISGLRVAINSAFKSGLEKLQAVSLPGPTRTTYQEAQGLGSIWTRRSSASSTRTSSSFGSARC
ncbi:hypothetical protein QC762_704430 [Podospora pseudocomata]|uniref:Uncharacterized protein n=1 Tax=Podospora pseudocomata TaxID=2093779 RepID=A0ABR0G299_9PEZI|nr:hypothetical protein QC762_704430 [Podospora pseudocomata]